MSNNTYSLKNKNWVELYKEINIPNDFLELCEGNKTIAQILYTQGVTSPQELQFHLKKYKDSTELTPGEELPHIKQAVNRISEAIDNKQNICIFGDYDVDGTTSTALLIRTFKILGIECDYYIPDRFTEGYGLNNKAVLKIKSQKKAHLLITCDCGITNTEEIKLANTFGLDVIVTDHHSLPEDLPPAIAVINPKILASTHAHYWLPGVGVAFKLAEILLKKYKKQKHIHELLDLVALGMIADLAPLRGENRLLTQQGLKVLAHTNKTGLKALLKECGYDQDDSNNKSTDEENVGFQLAPRINAAGRLADARDAVELFITEDELEAQQIVNKLSHQNIERQELCKDILNQAIEYIDKNINIKQSNVLFVSKEGWHHGVIGIVASKLVEKYHLPVFIACEDEGKVKGSARGIEGINLHEQMTYCDELFDKYGGHKMAAGFSMTLENWHKFQKQLPAILAKNTNKDDYQANLNINLEFSPEEISINTVNNILELAPFGLDFPKPVIKLNKKVTLTKIIPLGKERKHLKLIFNNNLEALLWNTTLENIPYIETGQQFELVFSAGLNTFQGRTTVQLDIKDWKVKVSKEIPEQIQPEPRVNKQEENNNNFANAKDTVKRLWSLIKEQKKEVLALNKQKLTSYLELSEDACEESLVILESTECLKFKIEDHLYKVKVTGNKPQKVKVSLSKLETILNK